MMVKRKREVISEDDDSVCKPELTSQGNGDECLSGGERETPSYF